MRLSGQQLQQIQEALLDAYSSVDELRMLARFELSENLDAVAGGANLRVVVFNLLTWAEQHGRLPDLIAGACRERPGNALLAQVQTDARQWFAVVTPPLDIEWITIPAGPFLMGSERKFLMRRDKRKDKMAQDDETPQHSVHLPEYYIARFPVTNAQYRQFVRAADYRIPPSWSNGEPPGNANHPVVNVTWHDACAYCAWASKVSRRDIRLPSEAEWEKAARGEDGRIWPWGNEPPDASRCNFRRGVRDTMPVDKYPRGASPYGVMDMVGSVWEWTNSQLAAYPYVAADGRENVGGPNDNTQHVLRGGAFAYNLDLAACAARLGDFPNFDGGLLGFRVVLSPFTSDC